MWLLFWKTNLILWCQVWQWASECMNDRKLWQSHLVLIIAYSEKWAIFYCVMSSLLCKMSSLLYSHWLQGIGVVLPLENQMRTPSDMRGWNGVLNTSMILVSCLYIAVGFFGYLKYGEQVAGSITLNLPVDEL